MSVQGAVGGGRGRAAARKRRRLYALLAGGVMLAVATALMLAAFNENITYFYSPTDLAERAETPTAGFRLGGLVAEGSVAKLDGGATTQFDVTDMQNTVTVRYTGILPDLFREGQGVVTQGTIGPDGIFLAREVLARHDENYMPPEVADALKRAGQWGHGGNTAMPGTAR